MTGWRLAGLWLLVGASLLAGIGGPPVLRSQEARVLETAREILDRPGSSDAWLLPELNGSPRLRKPPLAYWMSAVAFLTCGVDEGVGRVPTALVGWLTVGLTFVTADRLLDRRKAVFAAGALATSYLFYKHSRLAETDAPATLFVTAAVYAFLRAAETRRAAWHHAAAAAIGLAFGAKGAPGLFPLAFLLAYSACFRRWDVGLKFLTSGAAVVAGTLGGAWYAYAALSHPHGVGEFVKELRAVGAGEGHGGAFYLYFPRLLAAAAPWSVLTVAGVVGAAVRWRSDRALRVLLVWVAVVLVPLCVTPQKQFHYLVSLLPPAMILTGWAIDLACGGRTSVLHRWDRWGRVSLRGTLVGIAALAAAGVPAAALAVLGTVRGVDGAAGAAMAGLVGVALLVLRRRGWTAAVGGTMAGLLAALPLVAGFWYPRLDGEDVRGVAAAVRAVSPNGPYCFYGRNLDLPLVFYLGQTVPVVKEAEKLPAVLAGRPDTLVIATAAEHEQLARPPSQVGGYRLSLRRTIALGRHRFELYGATAVDP